MNHIVIIGGGIAGLAAAYRIQEEISRGAALRCTLLEGSGRMGGKIATERFDGFVLERGPDSFISQKPQGIELCRKLGLADRLVGTNPDRTSTYVYTGGQLVTLPEGLSLMIPTRFLPFAFSPLFSLPGKIRMGLDLFLPQKPDGSDESLAGFVRRRLGEEALRKMAEPMLAGIYAADPETMSIQSTFPMFVQTERKYRSLILGMLAQKRRAGGNSGPQKKPFSLFVTLKNGLGELVDALMAQSPEVTFRVDAPVRRFQAGGDRWQVVLDGGETLNAGAVILAPPAQVSARLLAPTAPKVAELLDRIPYVSTATVSLAYKKEGFPHPLDGFGFVVPRTEGRKILACTWTSSKFPHRAPEGYVLLRCFVGGALQESLAEQEEAAIAQMVQDELREILGIDVTPVFCKVFPNRKANVQYRVGHAQLIRSIEDELTSFPGLTLAGSAYTGIGIPDCIQNGTRAAESVINFLTDKTRVAV